MEKSYTITCRECKNSRNIKISNSDRIDWLEDGKAHSIVSGRKRLDGEWGWECTCGNKDIMTEQEKRMISNHAQPQPEELKTVINNLIIQTPQFELVER